MEFIEIKCRNCGAYIKAHEGDEVKLPTPKGVQTLEILEVRYTGEPPIPHETPKED